MAVRRCAEMAACYRKTERRSVRVQWREVA
jgi:hypothetical protein